MVKLGVFGRNRRIMKRLSQLIRLLTPDFIKPVLLTWIYFFRARKYLGSTYYCPVCDKKINSFISLKDVGSGKFMENIDIEGVSHSVYEYETLNVENFICPICGASDKARLYALFVKEKFKKSKVEERLKLVHFAPEMGLQQFLRWDRRISYRSADLEREGVDDQVDLANMSIYSDLSLDAFICSHILEHIEDDQKAISELYRVLKSGGWGVIMVPILLTIKNTYEDLTKKTPEERLKHFGLEDHVRVYAKQDFIDRLITAGFHVLQLGVEHFGVDVFERCGLLKTSVLYVVEK